MAKEVVTQVFTWCDMHMTDDNAREEAVLEETFTVGKLTRSIALCDKHADMPVTLGQLRETLKKYGTRVDEGIGEGPLRPQAQKRAEEAGDQLVCPIEECPRHTKPLRNRQQLRDHVRKIHNTSLLILEGARPDKKFPCPEPDCPLELVSLQGVAAHMRAHHPRVKRPAGGWGDAVTAV